MRHIEVIKPGMQTTVQDYPGRKGYWHVGIPPSGPMDSLAFRLGNRILGNPAAAAGLEITLLGPDLLFHDEAVICLTGAPTHVRLNAAEIPQWRAVRVKAGSTLQVGPIRLGARAYLLIQHGIDVEPYLGSLATFTLGQFGGHEGRQLQQGDHLSLGDSGSSGLCHYVDYRLIPDYSDSWDLHVLYGPQGAPDFFTPGDVEMFFSTEWEVHFNSSRTGIRLLGPKPQWARVDGGEAGLHPSNLHDNPYAIGSVDFTGDMPVILGPDGPSLGGFVCPATVIKADLWKLGQLKPGDKVRFVAVDAEQARQQELQQERHVETLAACSEPLLITSVKPETPVLYEVIYDDERPNVVFRRAGDANILIEFGEMKLDLEYRLRVHLLMEWVQQHMHKGIIDLTPGIRSLQIHFDTDAVTVETLIESVSQAEQTMVSIDSVTLPARRVYLPLSWDDASTQKAIDIYMQSVRDNAPWCPSNIEFIRRINGLDSVDDVKRIFFDANYLVMGLGDVYLGAPVATPLDPRHRLVTTKYNPARTWTPENAVGIGGAYLCVYGMEGPGGYQFVGRTLQMWNRDDNTTAFTPDKPWLLRFFDQIQFFEVSAKELEAIRNDFPKGEYALQVEDISFNYGDYQRFLADNAVEINQFKQHQQTAFEAERQRWLASGEIKRS